MEYSKWLGTKRRMDVQISIFERGVTGVYVIPWTPDKIVFKSGGVKFAAYNVMDVGEVAQAIGTNLFSINWNSRFPGVNNQNHPCVYGPWVDPEHWQSVLSIWKRDKTPLQILITNTPIFHDVILSDYEVTYKEPNGDYFYYIEFKENREPKFSITVDEPDTSDAIEREWNIEYDTYTVVDGDTLWGIAECYLGSGMRWSEIYDINKDVIEDVAVNHGFNGSDNGHWIFPGTVLKLPKATAVDSGQAGSEIYLDNTPIYVDSETNNIASRLSGTYYLYDGKNINGRYRITKPASLCGVKPVGLNVTGWIDEEAL